MPGADSSSFAASLPGGVRRRVWAYPEVRSHSLIVLTYDRLYAASLAGPPKPETLAAIETGADLDDTLGPLAVVVELVSVRRLKLDLLANALVVEYTGGRSGAGRLTATFSTPDAADACYTKLWRRLGDGFQLRPYARDAWAAARAPLALLAGALLVTAALVLALSVHEDTASARAAARASADGLAPEVRAGWANWRVVCAFGGATAAAAQVWLYRRLTRPPASLELVRS